MKDSPKHLFVSCSRTKCLLETRFLTCQNTSGVLPAKSEVSALGSSTLSGALLSGTDFGLKMASFAPFSPNCKSKLDVASVVSFSVLKQSRLDWHSD